MRKITGKIYAAGDIHGMPAILEYNVQNMKNCTVILLGDVGIFRYRDYKRFLELDSICKNNCIKILALRGNHDNPEFFNPNTTNEISIRFRNKFTNIEFIDYSIIDSDYGTIMLYPGAISRDRITRKSYFIGDTSRISLYKGGDWWCNEEYKYIPTEHVDIILSHNGPLLEGMYPESIDYFSKHDETLKEDIDNEQKKLYTILDSVKPSKWVFGHYHQNIEYMIKNTNCRCVDIDNIISL